MARFPCPCIASTTVKCTRHDPRLPTQTQAGAKIAWDRPETEPCERNTPGCCVDHEPGTDWDCDTW